MNSISAKEFLVITVLVSVFVGLSYALDCYHCDPEDSGCDDPIKGGRGVQDCNYIRPTERDNSTMSRVLDAERNKIKPGESLTYRCGAINVINKENKNASGIFRTCVVNTTTSDQCDMLKVAFKDEHIGDVVGCTLCNETSCNNFTIDAIKNSSPESFTSVLLYTFLSSFFVIFVI